MVSGASTVPPWSASQVVASWRSRVAHQADDVARARPAPPGQRGRRPPSGRSGTSVDPDPGGAGAHQVVELRQRPAPQVALLVGDHHDVAVPGADLAQQLEQVVAAGHRRRRGRAAAGAPGRRTPFMISSSASRPASLWARSMHHGDRRRARRSSSGPGCAPGRDGRSVSPSTTTSRGQADRQRGRRRGQRVLDVEPGQPGQRHRHVDQLDQRVGVASRLAAPRASRRSPWSPARRWASTSRIAGESGSRENTHGRALIDGPHRAAPAGRRR